MENSNKASSSKMQDVAKSAEKKGLAKKSAKKMSPMKEAAKKMQKSKKQAALSKKSTTLGSLKKKKGKGEVTKNTRKSLFKVKKSTSEEGMKTRATSNRASLESLMAGFQSEGRAKTALGMPLKDFSESATALLMSNYKVENEKVLTTTALAM